MGTFWNTKNTLIVAGSTLVVGGAGFLVYRNWRNKRLMIALNYALENRTSQYGDIRDFGDVFSGDAYVTKIEEVAKKNGYSIIKLNDQAVTKKRTEIDDAITGFTEDEDKIYGILRDLRDKVAIAQIAQSYKTHNKGLTLIGQLTKLLSPSELQNVTDIVAEKASFTKAIK